MSWSIWRKKQQDGYELVHQYGRMLLGYITGKTNDRIVSQDIAQEVWIRFFKEQEKVRNVRAFLFTVAQRLIIDHYRTKKLQVDLTDLVNSANYSGEEADTFILEREEYAKLKSILSEDEFEILQLTMEGYADEEIAQQLGKKEKTVANKKSLLKKKIHKTWDNGQR